MKVTREEMKAAQVPLAFRDYCAHILIPLNECRYDHWFSPFKCTDLRHAYEKCQYDECAALLGRPREIPRASRRRLTRARRPSQVPTENSDPQRSQEGGRVISSSPSIATPAHRADRALICVSALPRLRYLFPQLRAPTAPAASSERAAAIYSDCSALPLSCSSSGRVRSSASVPLRP